MQATKLVANDIGEVYGIPDMTGVLKATRIERKPGTAEVRLIGTVQSAGSASFTISGITVQYQLASLVNLPAGRRLLHLLRCQPGCSAQPKSRRLGEESEAKLRPHERLALALTFIQIAVALAAITVLTRRRWLLLGAVTAAAVGIAAAVIGLF